MSENERMERARRIRRMREGQREEDEESADAADDSTDTEPTPDADATAASETEAAGESTAAGSEPAEAPGDDAASTASTDGGATAATTDSDDASGDDGDDDESGTDAADAVGEGDPATQQSDGQQTDDAASEAVEDVSGTTASVPSAEEMEAAMEQTMEQAQAVGDEAADADATDESQQEQAPTRGFAGDATAEQTKDADTRILEFTLADEQYCLDIQYIEEIVKETNITRVPNTPDFVEGVVDLRGQITTILNPKVTLDKDDKSPGDLVVVFDSEAFEEQGDIGWVVDDVREVSPINEDEVNDPPMQEDYINGVIDRDDGEFVIWTTPDLGLEEAD